MLAVPIVVAAQAADLMPAPAEDVVVVAERLRKVRWTYHAKNGVLLSCTVKRPSGSAWIDAMICDASRQCAAENPGAGDRHLAPCIKDRVRRLFTAYRAERAAVR